MVSLKPTSSWRFWLLAACIVAGGAFFFSLEWKERFASDVSALLPAAEKDDETAELMSRVREEESRLILGILLPPTHGWDGKRQEVAAAFLQSLRESGRFEQVAEGRGPSDPDAVAAAVYEGRLDLLLPYWAEGAGLSTVANAETWATAIVASFEDFLTQPEANAMADLLLADPFPLVATMTERAPPALGEETESGPFPFWARQAASPFVREGQAPVLAALDAAANEVGAILPGAEVRHTSVAAFASESENRIRREITLLNACSVLLVAVVALVFLRRKLFLLHLVVIAVLSVAGGLLAALLFFSPVHILTLVMGGLLVGVAVDYGIHILLHRHESLDTGFIQTLHEVRKPLLASALSTAAGFAALTFGDLPLLRQIGVFVGGGLLTALAVSWLYLPLWSRPDAGSAVAGPIKTRRPRRWILALGAGLFFLPLAGWLRLEWHDDLRELQPALPEASQNDADVRRIFSGDSQSVSWLCQGETPRAARVALAAFEAEWQRANGVKDDLMSLSPWVAEPGESDAIRELFLEMPEFENALTEAFEMAGFDAAAFSPFFEELRVWRSPSTPGYNARLARIAAALDGPSGFLLRGGAHGWFFLVSAPEDKIPVGWEPPAGSLATAQIETLNELFSQYRQTAWRLSGISLLVIAGGILLTFGPGAGAATLALPCLAWAWGMGMLAGTVSPLSLFHVLGGFLGFCIALDYGLFFRHARETGHVLPRSIRVSAATTLSAFGVLSFSSIPAVAALGLSVFLVVFAALFIAEVLNRWQIPAPE